VDSGGGEVAASDQVWRAVEGWKARGIPVIASFGGTAASGGYYVACGCDSIVAEPTCVTGSIGVIAQMFTLKGLTDEVGIAPVTIVASGSPFGASTPLMGITGRDLRDIAAELSQPRLMYQLNW
jgi:protease-4